MNPALLAHVQAAQSTLDPQYQALHAAVAALKRTVVLASDETLDAIATHKHWGVFIRCCPPDLDCLAALAQIDLPRLATMYSAATLLNPSAGLRLHLLSLLE
jgi:hypothetical protein